MEPFDGTCEAAQKSGRRCIHPAKVEKDGHLVCRAHARLGVARWWKGAQRFRALEKDRDELRGVRCEQHDLELVHTRAPAVARCKQCARLFPITLPEVP